MKRLILLITIVCLATELFAQDSVKQGLKAVPVRQVSGIVIDSTEQTVIGAIVSLVSKTDTLRTSTNEDGLFFFKNVKAWEFTLSVSSLGYRTYVKVGKYNDSKSILTMDPITLSGSSRMLKEVIVDGTPSIKYKIDTVEYRASDYVVREGADVGDLLKKMEGMDLGKDGTLTYNGAKVKEARLNGKNFMSGDVATVTKSLPADIVDKVQVIEDYGDQAARSGIKDKDPVKVLNITTKAERSLGYFAKVGGGAGNDSRYEGNLNGTRINANRNYTLSAHINNTINGVSSAISTAPSALTSNSSEGLIPGGSGGNTQRQGAGFTYRDQWGSKTQVNMNYAFNLTDINSIDNSFSQDFSPNGTTLSSRTSQANGNGKTHVLSFDLEHKIDSTNYLKVASTFSYNSRLNDNRFANLLSGLIRQDQNSLNINSSATPSLAVKALYEHRFSKKGRLFTTELSLSNRDNEETVDQNTTITYFDLITNRALKDSLINRLINRNNLKTAVRSNSTFSEPLGLFSRLYFQSELTQNAYSNQTNTSDLNPSGGSVIIDSLSNMFRYSFSQARLGLSYNFNNDDIGFTLGATAIPMVLKNFTHGKAASVNKATFNVIPIFRFSYSWTPQQFVSVNYSGGVTEPVSYQIQPVWDVSNPQNPVVGNPGLSPEVNHSLSARYSHYLPNQKISITTDLNASLFEDKIIGSINQVADAYNSLKYERRFVNANGSYRTGGYMEISKQSSDRASRFSFGANVDYQRYPGLSNHVKNISSQWSLGQRLSLDMNPSENFNINPTLSHTFSRADNSLATAIDSRTRVFSLGIDGRIYFLKSWLVGYDVSKNYVSGINSNLTSNPFIVDAYLEKSFLKSKGAKISLRAFDVFNQNKFLNRIITETSVTDTKSNSMSRYFTVNMNLSLQKWKGTPTRNDKTLKRRGDGSFIY